jgi:hypothetical protein
MTIMWRVETAPFLSFRRCAAPRLGQTVVNKATALRRRTILTAPVAARPAHTVMACAGRPSTTLFRSTLQGVDGGSAAAMAWRGRRSTPNGAVNSARRLTGRLPRSRAAIAGSRARAITTARFGVGQGAPPVMAGGSPPSMPSSANRSKAVDGLPSQAMTVGVGHARNGATMIARRFHDRRPRPVPRASTTRYGVTAAAGGDCR